MGSNALAGKRHEVVDVHAVSLNRWIIACREPLRLWNSAWETSFFVL